MCVEAAVRGSRSCVPLILFLCGAWAALPASFPGPLQHPAGPAPGASDGLGGDERAKVRKLEGRRGTLSEEVDGLRHRAACHEKAVISLMDRLEKASPKTRPAIEADCAAEKRELAAALCGLEEKRETLFQVELNLSLMREVVELRGEVTLQQGRKRSNEAQKDRVRSALLSTRAELVSAGADERLLGRLIRRAAELQGAASQGPRSQVPSRPAPPGADRPRGGANGARATAGELMQWEEDPARLRQMLNRRLGSLRERLSKILVEADRLDWESIEIDVCIEAARRKLQSLQALRAYWDRPIPP
jgi:hypothetical protein